MAPIVIDEMEQTDKLNKINRNKTCEREKAAANAPVVMKVPTATKDRNDLRPRPQTPAIQTPKINIQIL